MVCPCFIAIKEVNEDHFCQLLLVKATRMLVKAGSVLVKAVRVLVKAVRVLEKA
jgi:hypothetical protein